MTSTAKLPARKISEEKPLIWFNCDLLSLKSNLLLLGTAPACGQSVVKTAVEV